MTESCAEFPARHVFIKCPECRRVIDEARLHDNLEVCPRCGKHFRVSGRDRMRMTIDEGTFEEWDASLAPEDFLSFPGYADKLKSVSERSGERDAVVCGKGKICGCDTALFFMDANFMMGSMGSVVGEKICRTFERATELGLPVVGFTVSGGARMQEGVTSLMQMAKISAAVRRHSEAGGLYITVLTDPTTGGVTASFAMEGDIILAEPDALTAFAGPRVIEQNMHKRLPKGFQRSEFLLEHGFCDAVVPRGEVALTVGELLALHEGHAPAWGHRTRLCIRAAAAKSWDICSSARPHQNRARDCQADPLGRSRHGRRDDLAGPGWICGAARRPLLWRRRRCGGWHWLERRAPVTVIAIERGTTTKERMRRNFGMAHPEGYRKARRLMRQAEKFGRPVLCLVDTSGAFCGIGAEERGQGEAIAQNLMEMSGLKTPIVSVVTGEGGSGGALALSVADRILMLSSSAYSVVSPEACASILWKDTERADEAAEALKLTAPDLLALGIIDGIVDDKGLSHEEIAGAVMSSAFDAFDTLGQLDDATLTNLRYEKYRAIGRYRTM